MPRILLPALLFWMALIPSLWGQTDVLRHLRACETQIGTKYKPWRMAPISKDVAEAAHRTNEDPTMAYGDFDGDGRRDVALFIQVGPPSAPNSPRRPDSLLIAVCFRTARGIKLAVIDKLACEDGISLAKKGHAYYDFESEKAGTYRLDGIHAYCFEKAGETYQFENGSFRRIIDSD